MLASSPTASAAPLITDVSCDAHPNRASVRMIGKISSLTAFLLVVRVLWVGLCTTGAHEANTTERGVPNNPVKRTKRTWPSVGKRGSSRSAESHPQESGRRPPRSRSESGSTIQSQSCASPALGWEAVVTDGPAIAGAPRSARRRRGQTRSFRPSPASDRSDGHPTPVPQDRTGRRSCLRVLSSRSLLTAQCETIARCADKPRLPSFRILLLQWVILLPACSRCSGARRLCPGNSSDPREAGKVAPRSRRRSAVPSRVRRRNSRSSVENSCTPYHRGSQGLQADPGRAPRFHRKRRHVPVNQVPHLPGQPSGTEGKCDAIGCGRS